MTNESTSLTLTTDELLAILQVMGASSMSGLGDPLAGLNEREQAARLNAGAETLLNRRLCTFEGDQLIMDDMLVALVGASLIPDATLLVTQVQSDQSTEPVYYHATPFIMVEHQSPRVGVHQFSYLPDTNTLTHRVEMRLAAVTTAPSRVTRADSWQLPDADVHEVLVAIREENLPVARAILSRHGWSGANLDHLLDDLSTAPSWVGMVGWGLREEAPLGGTSLIFYIGKEGNWLFSPTAGNSEQLTVTQPDGSAATQAFLHLLEPLFTVVNQD